MLFFSVYGMQIHGLVSDLTSKSRCYYCNNIHVTYIVIMLFVENSMLTQWRICRGVFDCSSIPSAAG